MDVWNEEAATYAEHWAPLAEPARHVIADALDIGAATRVLDVGCGSGDFCALALDRGATVSGIDASPAMIEIARRRAPGADLRVNAMERLPYDDGTFDAVTSFNSLQFPDDPVAVLREWARVLRPGGAIAVIIWGPREECEIDVVESAVRALGGVSAPRPRFYERLDGVIEAAGLELTDHGTVSVPFEQPDFERLALAMQFDARGHDVEETAAREAILAAAAPFRRGDGS